MSDPNTPHDPHEPGRRPGDPHEPGRRPGVDRDANPYTRYIIAGAAVIVLILAVVIFTGTGDEVGDPMATDPAVEEPGVTGATPPADPAAPTDPAAPADPGAAPADPDAAPADPEAQPQD